MKQIIQITSGRGPVECTRVVAKIQEIIIKDARKLGIDINVIDSAKGDFKGTLFSSTLLAEGDDLSSLKQYEGTVQWISRSPYRPMHKRKNWFVGVSFFDVKDKLRFNPNDVEITTARSGGPGGQSVNTTNSAVRAKHTPTGIQVFTQDSRSMLENKALALQRLEAKVLSQQTQLLIDQQQDQWQEHNCLERGNPVKTFNDTLK
jgi:peptide chain release factor